MDRQATDLLYLQTHPMCSTCVRECWQQPYSLSSFTKFPNTVLTWQLNRVVELYLIEDGPRINTVPTILCM